MTANNDGMNTHQMDSLTVLYTKCDTNLITSILPTQFSLDVPTAATGTGLATQSPNVASAPNRDELHPCRSTSTYDNCLFLVRYVQ